jgi:hypothetical protein
MDIFNNSTIQALCDIPKATEEEFLKREYGILLKYVDNLSDLNLNHFAHDGNVVIIVSPNPSKWVDKLNSTKDLKIIFFLIGNETYQPEVYNYLNEIENLYHVFIYNSPTKYKLTNIFGTTIGYIYDGGLKKTKSKGSIYRDARISFSLKNKFRKFKPNYAFSEFPQGYSNNFIFNLSRLVKLSESESLINNKTIEKIEKIATKNRFFSFIGQPTNRRREVFLRSAQKFADEEFIMNSIFQGTNSNSNDTYVKQLLHCKFILVPPGFFNNSNHRYTESLICSALPLILANNSLDPSENENWTKELSFLPRYSIKKQISFVSKLNDTERLALLTKIRKNDFQRIEKSVQIFNKLFNA